MEHTFNISNLIGKDIRSRSNANIIRSVIDGVKGNITLDFSGVSFISRSFADELCNVVEERGDISISLSNLSELVSSMIQAVRNGRTDGKRKAMTESEVKEFEDMKSLESFLSTIS